MDNESYFWFLNVLFYDLEVCVCICIVLSLTEETI